MNESNCGNLWLAPGTHKIPIKELIDNNREVTISDSLDLKLNSGDMVNGEQLYGIVSCPITQT